MRIGELNDLGPLHVNLVTGLARLPQGILWSVHMGNFSPFDQEEIQETKYLQIESVGVSNGLCEHLHEQETACRTHFHMRVFALRLALKQRHKRTRKWPIRAKAKFCEHFQIGWDHSILLSVKRLLSFFHRNHQKQRRNSFSGLCSTCTYIF